MKGLPSDLPDRFSEMIWLVDKIGRWWVVNVDIAPDPQHDGKHVDEEQVIPGPSMELRLMMDIALAPEKDSRKYIDEFIKRTRPAKRIN